MAAQIDSTISTTAFQSTAEPLIIQVSEPTAAVYYKYRFILVVKDSGGTTLATLKTHYLSSTNRVAAFDISRVLDDYLAPNLVNSNDVTANVLTLGRTGFTPSKVIGTCYTDLVARQFTIEVGHENATGPTTDPVESLNEDSLTLYAFRDEFVNDGEPYARGAGEFQLAAPSRNFMSVAPDLGTRSAYGSAWGTVREHRIGLDQAYVLAFGAKDMTAVYMKVRAWDITGTLIATANIAIDTEGGETVPTTDAQNVQFFGCGPANLEEYGDAVSSVALQTIFDDPDLAYYEVYASTSVSDSQTFQDSVVHRFTIDDGCSKYPRIQLFFLNRHGGWDAFNFDQRSEESFRNIQRSSYNRPRGNWDTITSLNQWTYSGWERGVTTTTVKAEKQVVVSTDYIDEGYADMLRDIATSRSVFIVDGTNLIPVVVTDSEYLFKTSLNDKLISYSFTLRYSNRPRLK